MRNSLADSWGREPQPVTEAAWYDILGRFKAVAAEFDSARVALAQSPVPADSDLARERATLMSQFNAVETQVRNVRNALSSVLNSISGAWDWVAGLLGGPGLGLLPAIPVAYAVVAGSLAAMTAVILSYRKYMERVAIYNDARAAGATPQQAAEIADKVDSGSSWFPTGGVPWTLVAVGVGALAALLAFTRPRR